MTAVPHDQLRKGQRVRVEYEAEVHEPAFIVPHATARYVLPDGNVEFYGIPKHATVTDLSNPEPEPKPERLTADTDLHDGMKVRASDGRFWVYDEPYDFWRCDDVAMGTRTLLRVGAVVVR